MANDATDPGPAAVSALRESWRRAVVAMDKDDLLARAVYANIPAVLAYVADQEWENASLKAALARARELSSPVNWTPEEEAFWREVDPVPKEKLEKPE